ncbi:MAG: 2-amino-4-hydroxy-6-hydroxymethyldihydropteridine diphosphokinase [Bacteriovoracaceae bacterium]
MSLIIASGSNIGDSKKILEEAKAALARKFRLKASSRIYVSAAVDYEAQPDFYNQVMEFEIPSQTPDEVMEILLETEKSFGRHRDIPKGPRTLDLDIIFWSTTSYHSENVTVPHPRWAERSFVVRPLQELPFFQTIQKCFTIPTSFTVEAAPLP